MSEVAVASKDDLLPRCSAKHCTITARPGQALCDDHAVELLMSAARRRLMESGLLSVEQLVYLCANAASEMVRLKAAEAILDRIGMRPGVDIQVTSGEPKDDPHQLVRERLRVIASRVAATEELPKPVSDRPLDALDDEAEQQDHNGT